MVLPRRRSAAISPTAHYTGHVWARSGLGDPRLDTAQGRLLHLALRPAMLASGRLGGPAIDDVLLARHRALDEVLEAAIASGEIGQVVEFAAGMSPRGLTFTARHPELVYVETDLPGMVARKRAALGGRGANHRVEELDALAPGGLAALLASLDPGRGVALVSEGLLNYLPRAAVTGLWARAAGALGAFPAGLLLSDLHVAEENGGLAEAAFTTALAAFVRGRVHLHFADATDAEQALLAAGFAEAALPHPAAIGVLGGERPGARRVRIVVARTAGQR